MPRVLPAAAVNRLGALIFLLGAIAVAQQPPVFECTAPEPAEHTGGTQLLGWGANWNGQLGSVRSEDDVVSQPAVMSVSSASAPQYRRVSGGLQHTLVLEASQARVFAAGSGRFAQLGGGITTEVDKVATFVSWEQAVEGSDAPRRLSEPVTDVAAGWYSSCALTDLGDGAAATPQTRTRIFCSGRNHRGQLAAPSVDTQIALPIAVAFNYSAQLRAGEWFVKLAAGPDHMSALTNLGEIFTWGAGASGELGTAAPESGAASTPVRVGALPSPATDLQCGFRFCVAVTANGGDVYGWGLNSENQLGGGSSAAFAPTPVRITGGASRIAVGGAHVLAVINGRLHCWGAATMGQCGVPKSIRPNVQEAWSVPTPTPIAAFANVAPRSIAAAHRHSLVLDTCGTVYAMGAEGLGQLGTETTGTFAASFRQTFPVIVSSLARRAVEPIAVFAGAFTSFVVVKE